MIEIDDPTDDERFESALHAVLQRATDNGLDLEGGWKISVEGDENTHWDLQIVAVEYDEGTA